MNEPIKPDLIFWTVIAGFLVSSMFVAHYWGWVLVP